MRVLTATDASRHFSDLLDAIEAGETVTVTRGGRAVAELRPAPRRRGAGLRTALAEVTPPDESFAPAIAEAVALLTVPDEDPWHAA